LLHSERKHHQEHAPMDDRRRQDRAVEKTEKTEKPRPGDEAPAGAPGSGEDICPSCGGSGRKGGAVCPSCGGTGRVNEGIGGG
jgi:DnaJ-class molecular chaperone